MKTTLPVVVIAAAMSALVAAPEPVHGAEDQGAHDPLIRARALAKEGKRKEAAALYERALKLKPSNALAHNELGVLLVSLGESSAATKSLWTAVHHDPNFVAAWANLAEVLRRSKSYALAYSAYGKAIELASDREIFWYGLATALKEDGKKAQSMSAYQSFIERTAPGSRRYAKAVAITEAWKREGVSPAAPSWLPAKVPESIVRSVKLAAQMSKRVGPGDSTVPVIAAAKPPQDTQETPQSAAETTEVDPRPTEMTIPEPPPRSTLTDLAQHNGDGAFGNKRFVEALQSYQAELSDAPDDVVLLYKTGATMAILGDFVGSNRMWQRALALAPQRGFILHQAKYAASRLAERSDPHVSSRQVDILTAARSYILQGKPARTLAVTEGQKTEELLFLRGEAALRMGLLTHAFNAFSSLLQLNPEDRQARGGLLASRLLRGADEALQTDIDAWMEEEGTGAERFMLLRQLQAERRIRFGKSTVVQEEEDE